MQICGLQKITLLDFPGLVACTVFTGGCNLRCPFCHNAPLVTEARPESLAPEDFFSFLRKRQGLLDGVAVTGGEPTLHPDLPDFLAQIRELGYRVKLDTNGTAPQMLRQILQRGLADRVAMDIKNSPERYALTVGLPGFDIAPVRESARLLMESGVPFEFRTTVVKPLHRAEDFEAIGQWLRGSEEFYLQSYTDSGHVISPDGLSSYSAEELRGFADIMKKYIPNIHLRGVEE